MMLWSYWQVVFIVIWRSKAFTGFISLPITRRARWRGSVQWLASMLLLLGFPHWVMAQSAWVAPPLLEGTIKITAEELPDLKAEFADLVIIDTRPADHDNPLTIEGAVAVSYAITPNSLSALTKDKFTPLVFFGADEHSINSFKAAKAAVTLGYSVVFWFRGGMQEWLDKGMPVVRIQK